MVPDVPIGVLGGVAIETIYAFPLSVSSDTFNPTLPDKNWKADEAYIASHLKFNGSLVEFDVVSTDPVKHVFIFDKFYLPPSIARVTNVHPPKSASSTVPAYPIPVDLSRIPHDSTGNPFVLTVNFMGQPVLFDLTSDNTSVSGNAISLFTQRQVDILEALNVTLNLGVK